MKANPPLRPLFSIVTVTYNAETTLPRTLESVREQSCRLFEWLVIDGASTDRTVAIARESGIAEAKVVSAPDRGIYDAMNKGIDMSTGDYLIFLNAGDTLHSPDTLQTYADAIMDNDYPGIVYGRTDIVDNRGHRLGSRHLEPPEHLTLDSFKDGMCVSHQSMAVLKKVAGEYDLRYRLSADYEWAIRCLQRSRRNVFIPKVVSDYLYEGLTTRNRRRSLMERFRIMCHYYGTMATIARHIRFIPRFLKRRKTEKRFSECI